MEIIIIIIIEEIYNKQVKFQHDLPEKLLRDIDWTTSGDLVKRHRLDV